VRDCQTTANYAIMPEQGLNNTGRYTDKTGTVPRYAFPTVFQADDFALMS
jgi:hypothetical protein